MRFRILCVPNSLKDFCNFNYEIQFCSLLHAIIKCSLLLRLSNSSSAASFAQLPQCGKQWQQQQSHPGGQSSRRIATIRGASAAIDRLDIGRGRVHGALVCRIIHVLIEAGAGNHALAIDCKETIRIIISTKIRTLETILINICTYSLCLYIYIETCSVSVSEQSKMPHIKCNLCVDNVWRGLFCVSAFIFWFSFGSLASWRVSLYLKNVISNVIRIVDHAPADLANGQLPTGQMAKMAQV